jgi:hypothetical protein
VTEMLCDVVVSIVSSQILEPATGQSSVTASDEDTGATAA